MTQTINVNDKIHLTEIRSSDKPQFVEYLNNKEHFDNTLMIPFPYTEADADFFINLCRETEIQHGRIVNFAIRNSEGLLIGGTGLMLNDKPSATHKAQLGYWVGKPFWGQGIMTEVLRVFSDYWLEQDQFKRLEATVFAPNIASQRVLEKAGFVREGFCPMYYVKPQDGLPRDAYIFAKLKKI